MPLAKGEFCLRFVFLLRGSLGKIGVGNVNVPLLFSPTNTGIGAVCGIRIGCLCKNVDGMHKQLTVIEALTAKIFGDVHTNVDALFYAPLGAGLNAVPSQAARLHSRGVCKNLTFGNDDVTCGAKLQGGGIAVCDFYFSFICYPP